MARYEYLRNETILKNYAFLVRMCYMHLAIVPLFSVKTVHITFKFLQY